MRIGDWRRLLGAATHIERVDGKLRAVFAPSAGVITEVARLCEAEIACCPFFEFNVEISARGVVVTVGGSAAAEPLIDAVFAPCDPPDPRSRRR